MSACLSLIEPVGLNQYRQNQLEQSVGWTIRQTITHCGPDIDKIGMFSCQVVITDKFLFTFFGIISTRVVVIKSPGNPRTQSDASWPRQLLPVAGLAGRVLTAFLKFTISVTD